MRRFRTKVRSHMSHEESKSKKDLSLRVEMMVGVRAEPDATRVVRPANPSQDRLDLLNGSVSPTCSLTACNNTPRLGQLTQTQILSSLGYVSPYAARYIAHARVTTLAWPCPHPPPASPSTPPTSRTKTPPDRTPRAADTNHLEAVTPV